MIPIEPVNLNRLVTKPHRLKELDIMKGKSARQQKSCGSKPLAQGLSRGGCPGKGPCQIVDPGAIVEEKSQHQSADFQKARDADLKQQRLTRSHEPTEKNKINREKLPTAGLHSL
jgi:hypothetical protein